MVIKNPIRFMATILVSDVHFTNNPRDEYRWGLLPWLVEQVDNRSIDQVLILGDLTDHKDRHPSSLVTRLSDGLHDLGQHCAVVVLRGNHDAVDPNLPFFGFVNKFPNVFFISEPTEMTLSI